ncbi:MAG: type IV secretory system conjugative DNA transfer family protein [Clostridia bacterium]
MKNLLRKIKKESKPFLIVYILFDIIVIGSLVLAAHNVPDTVTNSFDKFNSVFKEFLPNIYTFKFITAIFVDFSGFISASFWTLIIFIGLFISWKVKFSKNSEFEDIENGSGGWSQNGDEFDKLDDGGETLNKKEGFILSKKHYLNTDLRKVKINKNILVFGGSGTGKSACYIKPNILQKLGSYVITDPKGELYRETSGYLKANGYKVKVLDLIEPEYSDRYNPLAHIQDNSDVDIVAHTIVQSGESGGGSKDPFWENTSKMLLKACIYYVLTVLPKEERNLSSCLNIVRAGGSDESIFDKLFIDELKPEHPGRKEYEGIRLGADRTKQSIAISLVSKLTHFDTPDMQKITTTNDIDFEDLGNQKTAIYVITPADHSTYDYIVTIFFSQLLQTLYSQANKAGGTLPNQVYLLLDEFANIGQIPDFNKKLSTTRSLGISVSVVVQSIDQLEGLYKETYENIIGNCDTQLFLGSKSIKTCEYICKSLGQKTIKVKSKSISKDKKEKEKQGVSISEQKQGRELMTLEELMRMDYNEEIILIRGLRPIKTQKAWYYKFHPQREIAKEYEIKNSSYMPKPVEVEIKTMDVAKHLEDRIALAREKIAQQNAMNKKQEAAVNNKTDFSNGEQIEKDLTKQEQSSRIDIQKELEKKFDELFGSSNKH